MTGMVQVALKLGADHDGFRQAVRRLLAGGVEPARVGWRDDQTPGLFDEAPEAEVAPVLLPQAATELARLVVCHTEPERYALLYRLFWRLRHGEREVLEVLSDPLVHRLHAMAKSVRRDLHKMHAFVRFRRVQSDGAERWLAWFEPDHFIVEATGGFFVNRFRGMDWSILTPKGSLHWDRRELRVGPPAPPAEAAEPDAFEAHWRGYYESTFNPARLNPELMRKEMPRRYWKNLPEAEVIGRLQREASGRVEAMVARQAADARKRDPAKAVAAMREQGFASLEALNRAIADARPPAPFSSRAVLGEGPLGAEVALVGEQPGDQEDLQGRPFVGPAGQLLDRALADAGVHRSALYVTNAVKHFKHQMRGKRRIHQSPTAGEVKHYRWWLQQELGFVGPRLVVALGATATLALAGRPLAVAANRGPAELSGASGWITVHPSYLLRLPDPAEQARAYAAFVEDLRRAWAAAVADRLAGAA